MQGLVWLAAGVMGAGMLAGLGKMYRDWQTYQVQRTQPRNPWDIS